ncbi:MAG: Nudix family hydrolase [Gammaproteobacteria bacterium]|nr:Nudix family hydrolase [Gammaproteobacteria bacterium]
MFEHAESDASGRAAVHVAVAVICNAAGEVLVTLRPPHADQGDRWEFPGGKVEPGEDVRRALEREIEEEVGLHIESARPLIRLRHAYPSRSVLLDVWLVTAYRGQARGREGQRLAWRAPRLLDPADFPAANPPIITALRLPSLYLITPEPKPPYTAFLSRLECLLEAGIRLVQLRAKSLGKDEYRRLAGEVVTLCRARGAGILLNADPDLCHAVDADGVHLTGERLQSLSGRPLPAGRWVAASCHDRRQIDHAARIGADFIAVAPVRATRSHPDATPLGWGGLRDLLEPAVVPAYALGGLGPADLRTAWEAGAQGVAAISALWDAPDPAGLIRAVDALG